MKNLENFGVQELNSREMEEVNGGIIPILIAVAIYLACTTKAY